MASAPSLGDIQSFVVDATSGDPNVQRTVTERVESLHALAPRPKAEVISHLIGFLADGDLTIALRRVAGSVARQLVEKSDPGALLGALPVARIEEPLLLALCDADKGVRGTAAWCVAAVAKRQFSDYGDGWPSLPEKLRTLCISGSGPHEVGAATCLALIAEDCGVKIVQAASDAANTLRTQLLELITGLVDGAQTLAARRKAVTAATHFMRAGVAPTVDLDDFNEDGEIDPAAESRNTIGRQQMSALVTTLAPRFLSHFESTLSYFANEGPAALAEAVGSSGGDSTGAASQWTELATAIDGVNVMFSFEDAMAPFIAPAVQYIVALFVVLATAVNNGEASDSCSQLLSGGDLEDAVVNCGKEVLTLVTDIVIPNDDGIAAVRDMDANVPETISAALQAVGSSAASLSDAFYGALLRFGMRLNANERADVVIGQDCDTPDPVTAADFRGTDARRGGKNAAGDEDDEEDIESDVDAEGGSPGNGPTGTKMSALRSSSTWLVSSMASVINDNLLDGLLPHLHAVLSISVAELPAQWAAWQPVEGALRLIAVIFDVSLKRLVERDVASQLLDVSIAFCSSDCPIGPVRAAACNALKTCATSLLDWALVEDAAPGLATTLAPIGARCVQAIGNALRDINKSVQREAFEAMCGIVSHVHAVTGELDVEEIDESAEESAAGGQAHALCTLFPVDTVGGIYSSLVTNYEYYQLVARTFLYDLLAMTAEADAGLANLRADKTMVLLSDSTLIPGLVSLWRNMPDLQQAAPPHVVYESAALAGCISRIVVVCGAEAATACAPDLRDHVATVMGVCSHAGDAEAAAAAGRDVTADEDLLAAALGLLTALCDAVGPEAAFEQLLSAEVLQAAGGICNQPTTVANAETQKFAFALLGDFGATSGKMAAARVADAAGMSGGVADVPSLLASTSAPLVEQLVPVTGTVVRVLFTFNEDYTEAMINAMWCMAEWVNACPAAAVMPAFEANGGTKQFMTMVSLFASNEGIQCGTPAFRENAVLLIVRMIYMFPEHAPELVSGGLLAVLAARVGKMGDPLERSETFIRLALALQTGGGVEDALAAAHGLGFPVYPTSSPDAYAALFNAFAESPRGVLKLAASALVSNVKLSSDERARGAAALAKTLWGGIAAQLLPHCPLDTKEATKGFTKKEITALQRASC